jgi:hypothetical protein
MKTIYCDYYEICGTATYVLENDLEHYEDGYQCGECLDTVAEFAVGMW